MRGMIQEHLSAKDAKDAKKSSFLFSVWVPVSSCRELRPNLSLHRTIDALLLSSRPLRPLRTKTTSSVFAEVRQ
jgi:hypothetical protein